MMKSIVKKGMYIVCLAGCLLMILAGTGMVRAGEAGKGQIRIGKMRIIPNLSVKSSYDDNIYLGNGSNNTGEIEEDD